MSSDAKEFSGHQWPWKPWKIRTPQSLRFHQISVVQLLGLYGAADLPSPSSTLPQTKIRLLELLETYHQVINLEHEHVVLFGPKHRRTMQYLCAVRSDPKPVLNLFKDLRGARWRSPSPATETSRFFHWSYVRNQKGKWSPAGIFPDTSSRSEHHATTGFSGNWVEQLRGPTVAVICTSWSTHGATPWRRSAASQGWLPANFEGSMPLKCVAQMYHPTIARSSPRSIYCKCWFRTVWFSKQKLCCQCPCFLPYVHLPNPVQKTLNQGLCFWINLAGVSGLQRGPQC